VKKQRQRQREREAKWQRLDEEERNQANKRSER